MKVTFSPYSPPPSETISYTSTAGRALSLPGSGTYSGSATDIATKGELSLTDQRGKYVKVAKEKESLRQCESERGGLGEAEGETAIESIEVEITGEMTLALLDKTSS